MKLRAKLFLAAVMLQPASGVISGDILLLDVISEEPLNSAEGLPRPKRGASMDEVRQRFGEPLSTRPWVGAPPITRWLYDRYTVYFEHGRVIHSVVKR